MRSAVAALLIGFFATACHHPRAAPTAEYFVFGTRVTVTVRGTTPAVAGDAFAQLGNDFQRMHQRWHPWAPGALSELNEALRGGAWVPADADLVALIQASQRMETLTRGHFNAAIGALVSLWGFHTSDYPLRTAPPGQQEILQIVERHPSSHAVVIERQRVRSTNDAVRFDFSGIAKGMALAQACDRLAGYGIAEALINAGGDVMACGATSPPWRIAIRRPRHQQQETLPEVVNIDQRMAVFTSGNDQRFGEWEGERYAHILDPATGYPVDDILQVTVIHPDPLVADAAATALVVAGQNHWRGVAEALALQQVIVVLEDGGVEKLYD